MRNVFLGMMLFFVTLSTQAQEVKNKNAKHSVVISGNCEQCQKRIQKAAFSVNGVKSAIWGIEDHNLILTINEEKTSLSEVKKAIAKAGHDTEDFKTTDETFNNLPGCCQYDRGEKLK